MMEYASSVSAFASENGRGQGTNAPQPSGSLIGADDRPLPLDVIRWDLTDVLLRGWHALLRRGSCPRGRGSHGYEDESAPFALAPPAPPRATMPLIKSLGIHLISLFG